MFLRLFGSTCLLAGLVGCSSGSSSSAPAAPQPPIANAGGPYTGTAAVSLGFSAAGSTDPQGQTLTYAWSFGDGTTSTNANPAHTYATAGSFTVSLTVTDTSSLSATARTVATIAAAPLAGVSISGTVTAAQQPVTSVHVYLFAANTTGYGQPSVSLLNAANTGASDALGAFVPTNATGSFDLAHGYTCPANNAPVYLFATGGSNASASWLAALGSCPTAATTVTLNEVTTVAAAYALAGFATDATHVASSGTALAQTGIANAFANAGNLVNVSNGTALKTTPAGNGIVPQAEIDTLANLLASCTGNVSKCSAFLSTATSNGTSSGAAPSDTASAALNLAHNPQANIAALYASASPAVFSPALTAQPADFSLTLQFSGGALAQPEALAIDGSGSVWVANQNAATISKFSSLGAVLSGAGGFTGGGLNNPSAVAIDPTGNAWVPNYVTNAVTELSPSGAVLSGATGYATGGAGPLAIDGSGNVWFASGLSVIELSNAGSNLSGSQGYPLSGRNLASFGLAIDSSGNVWVPSTTNNSVAKLSSTGSNLGVFSGLTGGGLQNPTAVAIDNLGSVWIVNSQSSSGMGGTTLTRLSNAGASLAGPGGYSVPSLQIPSGIAIDGLGNAWISDFGTSAHSYTDSGLTEVSPNGITLSPLPANFAGGGVLAGPVALALDGSGDVWTVSSRTNTLSEVIGIAAPVVTPLSVGVKNNTLGTRP